MPEIKNCFVICPIGEPDSPTRKRADTIFKYIIAPAVEKCGYQPLRADQISESGMITHQIIQHLIDDPLVIADLTDHNANVYYELAVRHAARKPVVAIIESGQIPNFDIKDVRTIPVAQTVDIAEKAKADIVEQIKQLEIAKQGELQSPISTAIDLIAIHKKALQGGGSDTLNASLKTLDSVLRVEDRLNKIEKTINELGNSKFQYNNPIFSLSDLPQLYADPRLGIMSGNVTPVGVMKTIGKVQPIEKLPTTIGEVQLVGGATAISGKELIGGRPSSPKIVTE